MTQAVPAFNYLENCKISGQNVDPLHIKQFHFSLQFLFMLEMRIKHLFTPSDS